MKKTHISKFLLGVSILALNITVAHAQGGEHGNMPTDEGSSRGNMACPDSTRTVQCLDHKGRPITPGTPNYITYCESTDPLIHPQAGERLSSNESCPNVCGGSRPRTSGGGRDRGNRTGGGFVDTTGDGRGDTRADEAPPGNWDSSNTMGGRASGDTRVSDSGWVSGTHDDGETGRSSAGDRSNDTVLCTYFHRLGYLSDDDYYNGFIYSLNNAHQATWRGYHFWAVPYVEYLYKNPDSILAKLIKPVVLHRAKEISFKLGLESKPDYLGKLFRLIIEPISFSIGLFVEQRDLSSLYTKKELAMFSIKRKEYKRLQKFKEQGILAGTPLSAFTV